MCPKAIEFANTVSKSLAEIFSPPEEPKPDRFYSEPLVFYFCPRDKSIATAAMPKTDHPIKAGWVNTPWGPRPP